MKQGAKRIGEILLGKKLITEAQLYDALAEQNKSNEFLGNILLNKGWINDRQLTEVLSEQFNIPVVDLKKQHIDMGLAGSFLSSLILDHKCFPLSQDDESVTVAIVNPLNAVAISKIEEEARPRRVKLVLVAEEDLKIVLQDYRHYISQGIQRLLRRDRKN